MCIMQVENRATHFYLSAVRERVYAKTAKFNASPKARMEIAGGGVQIQFPQIYPGARINVFYCAAPGGFIRPGEHSLYMAL